MAEAAGVVMITGQQEECTKERFDTFYKPAIMHHNDAGKHFVLGAADGADYYAMLLLQDIGAGDRVTVYDKGEKDGRGAVARGFKLVNGFGSYPQRDGAMRARAGYVVAYLFENATGSGTFENVLSFALERGGQSLGMTDIPRAVVEIGRTFDRASKYASQTWTHTPPEPGLLRWHRIVRQPWTPPRS